MGNTPRYRLPSPTPITTTPPLQGTQAKNLAQAVDKLLNPVIVADDTARDLRFPLVGRRTGQQVFREDTNEIEFWDGSAWAIWSELRPANAQYPTTILPPSEIDGYQIRAITQYAFFTGINNRDIYFPQPFSRACLGVQAGFLETAWYDAVTSSTPNHPAMLQVVGWDATKAVVAQRDLTSNSTLPLNGYRYVSIIAWGY